MKTYIKKISHTLLLGFIFISQFKRRGKVLERILSFLKKLSDTLDKATRVIAIPVVLVFMLIVFLGVASRFIFRVSIIASEEYTRIGFAWACFLGAAICVKKESHINFSALTDKLDLVIKNLLRLFVSTLSCVFFVFLFVYGIKLTGHVLPTYFPASQLSQICGRE